MSKQQQKKTPEVAQVKSNEIVKQQLETKKQELLDMKKKLEQQVNNKKVNEIKAESEKISKALDSLVKTMSTEDKKKYQSEIQEINKIKEELVTNIGQFKNELDQTEKEVQTMVNALEKTENTSVSENTVNPTTTGTEKKSFFGRTIDWVKGSENEEYHTAKFIGRSALVGTGLYLAVKGVQSLWRGIFGGKKDKKESTKNEDEGFWDSGIGKTLKWLGLGGLGVAVISQWDKIVGWFKGDKTEENKNKVDEDIKYSELRKTLEENPTLHTKYQKLGENANIFSEVLGTDQLLGTEEYEKVGNAKSKGFIMGAIGESHKTLGNILKPGAMERVRSLTGADKFGTIKSFIKAKTDQYLINPALNIVADTLSVGTNAPIVGNNIEEMRNNLIKKIENNELSVEMQQKVVKIFKQYMQGITYLDNVKKNYEYECLKSACKNTISGFSEKTEEQQNEIIMKKKGNEAFYNTHVKPKLEKFDTLKISDLADETKLKQDTILKEALDPTLKNNPDLKEELASIKETEKGIDDLLGKVEKNGAISNEKFQEVVEELASDIDGMGFDSFYSGMTWYFHNILETDDYQQSEVVEQLYQDAMKSYKDALGAFAQNEKPTVDDLKKLRELKTNYFKTRRSIVVNAEYKQGNDEERGIRSRYFVPIVDAGGKQGSIILDAIKQHGLLSREFAGAAVVGVVGLAGAAIITDPITYPIRKINAVIRRATGKGSAKVGLSWTGKTLGYGLNQPVRFIKRKVKWFKGSYYKDIVLYSKDHGQKNAIKMLKYDILNGYIKKGKNTTAWKKISGYYDIIHGTDSGFSSGEEMVATLFKFQEGIPENARILKMIEEGDSRLKYLMNIQKKGGVVNRLRFLMRDKIRGGGITEISVEKAKLKFIEKMDTFKKGEKEYEVLEQILKKSKKLSETKINGILDNLDEILKKTKYLSEDELAKVMKHAANLGDGDDIVNFFKLQKGRKQLGINTERLFILGNLETGIEALSGTKYAGKIDEIKKAVKGLSELSDVSVISKLCSSSDEIVDMINFSKKFKNIDDLGIFMKGLAEADDIDAFLGSYKALGSLDEIKNIKFVAKYIEKIDELKNLGKIISNLDEFMKIAKMLTKIF